MTDFFLTAHSVWQYVVLAAVVVSLYFAFANTTMDPTAERMYRITTVVVDIQVALGLVLWIVDSGWSLGFLQGWLHPIIGLSAVGVLHAFVSRAREGQPEAANRTMRLGLVGVIVLVVAAIAIGETA